MLESVVFLHLLGASYHPQVSDMNERNWGVGASVEAPGGYVGGDVYRDSYGEIAAHVARGYTYDLGPVRVGGAFGVAYRPSNKGGDFYPMAVPTASIGADRIRARVTYVPPVAGPQSEVVAGQLVIRIGD